MVERMGWNESKTSQSNDLPVSCDLNLPVLLEPLREHWPSAMSWEAAMNWFDLLRERLPNPYGSAEERLRDKNPNRFRIG